MVIPVNYEGTLGKLIESKIIYCSCGKKGLVYHINHSYVCCTDCGLDVLFFSDKFGWFCGVDGHKQLRVRPVNSTDVKID